MGHVELEMAGEGSVEVYPEATEHSLWSSGIKEVCKGCEHGSPQNPRASRSLGVKGITVGNV